MTKFHKSFILSPIGNWGDTSFLTYIIKEIERVFGYPSKISVLIDNIDFAFNSTRNQYHSTPILQKFSSLSPPNIMKILSLTDVDLFIPILTYVYGEAELGGKSAILSTYRLKEELPPQNRDEVYLFRLIKESLHELGHTFNLRHCRDSKCLMHYARNIRDVDNKTDNLCRYCKILLEDEIKKL
ncbi:MAG: hypothetical protein HQK79_02180 [Desulfobacterales bacterium]|nr:hypothetical protein [Desulfobacterales bacterium]MBF0397090.1 hypothetical protein [Desulfobacterales bacterium]